MLGACALALRAGIAELPSTLGWRHLWVLGLTAGIGFTMALFVAQLAFSDPAQLAAAKVGLLSGSLFAALAGAGAGRLLLMAADAKR